LTYEDSRIQNIVDGLRSLVANELGLNLEIEDVDADAPLLEGGLNLDSLAIVELITLIEKTFGFEFGEQDLNMEAFASLRTLAGVIAHRRVLESA
jgi:acyl carrier protein